MPGQDPQSLSGIALLAHLDEDRLAALARQCRWQQHAARQQIIDRQSEARDVFFVTRGKVQVVNYSRSGRAISFDEVHPGGYFGELAALDGMTRSANVVALTETETAALPPETFMELVFDDRKIGHAVLERLAGMVRHDDDRIMELSTLGSYNRIYAELLRRARPGDGEDDAATGVIENIPTNIEIASRVSTTPETVARVVSDLTRKGVVARDGDALRILDLPRLVGMVEDFRVE